MKKLNAVHTVAFEKVINLFVKRSDNKYILESSFGKGYVLIFHLEKGLQARIWDCCFNECLELFSDKEQETENTHFTLAFFPNMQGLRFAHNGSFLQENLVWDTLFISASTSYKINIVPKLRSRCLGISFSKKWLIDNVFKDNDSFSTLRERFDFTSPFSLLESMSVSEKRIIEELMESSWKTSLGSFYIKSSVLNIVCDFFYKLKEKIDSDPVHLSSIASLTEIEKYLSDQILSPLPNLKELSGKFCMSESTLKRHFKKRYGATMSDYFHRKKMEYAQTLLSRESKNVKETANMLGYKNAINFLKMYKKYSE